MRQKEIYRTTLVNPTDFYHFFTELLKQGKDILYIAFSSALSGTYQSATIAIDMLKGEYPNQKIIAVDTLSASFGEGYLVYRAAFLRKEGKTIEEIASWIEENKLKLNHIFTVEDLGTLKRGGRLSSTAAIIGSLLRIKPILHVNNEGKLVALSKAVGRKKSLNDMIEVIKNQIVDPTTQTIFIGHGDALEDAQFVGNTLKKELKVKDVVYSFIGPVIGSHSGPGTIAVFFMGDKRE
jgi:DegV family protein with EDD domain